MQILSETVIFLLTKIKIEYFNDLKNFILEQNDKFILKLSYYSCDCDFTNYNSSVGYLLRNNH